MPVAKTVAVNRAHIQLVLNDPEYYEDIRAGLSQDKLKKRWGLCPDDSLMSAADYKLYKDGFVPFTGGLIRQDDASGEFTVLLKPDVKKHQFEELWEYLQRTRRMNSIGRQSKLKSPDDPELLYAIFKARVRGQTFPQIFNMYRSGTLPSYLNKPRNNFATEFDIKKYYSKYYNPL